MTQAQPFPLTPVAADRSELRLQAVAARREIPGEPFVYAVVTTGIYCRPTCPSRRPKPENVCLFDSAAEAEAAGFRACLRCRPQGLDPQGAVVQRLCRYIESHLDERLKLDALADLSGWSSFHLQRTFRKLTGVSPREYAEACRRRRLQGELSRSGANATVTDSILNAGYGSASRAYENAGLGMAPSRWRAGGAGEEIRFGVTASRLGPVLVAATGKGICCVRFGESAPALEAELRADFPKADVEDDREGLAEWLAVVRELAEGHAVGPLPLDIRGTAFQQRVWSALRSIPRGETRSYRQVAEEIGEPAATRAVARACASNPVAMVVPCHRVIGSGGALSGYRWGVERKRALLGLEGE